jgi:hypothetical protein
MALAPSGAVLAGLLAAVLAACSGTVDPAAGDLLSVPNAHAGAVQLRMDELLPHEGAEEWLIPAGNGLRVSLAKFTWTEEVAAGTEAGDTPLLEMRGLKTEPEYVDGD